MYKLLHKLPMYKIIQQIKDFRSIHGKRYQLRHILLFSILAILSEAHSYRDIASFIEANFKFFKKRFRLRWRSPPAYSTIRSIILGINSNELEGAVRDYCNKISAIQKGSIIAIDGKTVRNSFDKFTDSRAIQVLSAFNTDNGLILGHKSVNEDKTNEIPKLRELLKELKITGCTITADAMHCQKKA